MCSLPVLALICGCLESHVRRWAKSSLILFGFSLTSCSAFSCSSGVKVLMFVVSVLSPL